MATKADLQHRLALLESVHDQLFTELHELDQLMRKIGFSQGIATVKASAHEILDGGYLVDSDDKPADNTPQE